FAEEPDYRERFQQEARSVARLKHPNILEIFDYGYDDGTAYLVLELVEGGTLADRVGKPMELREVVRVLEPIGSAIDHAHAHGILHRDIKPSNILLQQDGTPVLADFGLAKMRGAAHRLTSSGTTTGRAPRPAARPAPPPPRRPPPPPPPPARPVAGAAPQNAELRGACGGGVDGRGRAGGEGRGGQKWESEEHAADLQ